MGSGCLVPSYKVLGRDSAKATGCVIDILISANNDPGHKNHCLYFFGKADLSINCLTTALWMYAKAVYGRSRSNVGVNRHICPKPKEERGDPPTNI